MRRDRLRLYRDGKVTSEWAISSAPEPVKKGLALRLISAGGAARAGRYSGGMDRLTLTLTGDDIGLPRPAKYLGYTPPRVFLALTRKAP